MEVSRDYLLRRFDYDPETGELRWKLIEATNRLEKTWNTRYGGKLAGSLWDGYLRVNLDRKHYRVHRLIWTMMTGETPIEIDHCDLNRSNNRWINLREATRNENARNGSVRCQNVSGLKGVSFTPHMRKRPYRAWIKKDGVREHLGYHATAEEAHAAYCEASQRLHGDFGRTV